MAHLDCLAYGHATTRFPLDDDVHLLDALKFYIARPSGLAFGTWGMANAGFDSSPWLRVTGTTPTSPGIDACIP